MLAPRARGPGIFLGLLLRHAAPTNRLPRKYQILFCPDSPALLIPSSPLKPPVCLPTIYSCRTLVFDLSPRRFDILTLIVDQAASDLTCRRRSLLLTQDKTTTESVSPTRVDRRVVRNVDEGGHTKYTCTVGRTAQYTAPLVLLPATIGITIAILLHLYLGCGVEAGELCLVGRTMEYGPAIPPVLSRLVSA